MKQRIVAYIEKVVLKQQLVLVILMNCDTLENMQKNSVFDVIDIAAGYGFTLFACKPREDDVTLFCCKCCKLNTVAQLGYQHGTSLPTAKAI